MIKVGIIGCGTIGAKLAKYIDADLKAKAQLIALSDADEDKARVLAAGLESKPKITTIDDLIAAADLIIEAASAKVSCDIAMKAVRSGKEVMIMSTGGLLKDYKELFKAAERSGVNVYLPSGAICGLDGLKAAKFSKINKVTLTTRKPPKGFTGAPYVIKNNVILEEITSDRALFEGSALDAIDGFPANINVAATLSICGIGAKETKVKIMACPSIDKNIHEVEVEGDFGRIFARTENVPSPDNPKTSHLAVLSAIATLNGITEMTKVGT